MTESFDFAAARRLAIEIQSELAELPHDNAKYRELRQELDELNEMLAKEGAAHPDTPAQARSVHGAMDRVANELQADGIRASAFIAELGRILGLD